MIGNLFSAISIALMSSVFVVGQVRSNDIIPPSQDTPNLVIGTKNSNVGNFDIFVPNMEVAVRYLYEVEHPVNNAAQLQWFGLNNAWGVDGDNFTNEQELGIDINHLANVGIYPRFSGLVTNLNYIVDLYIVTTGEQLVFDYNTYSIDGIEFFPTIIGYDENDNVISIEQTYLSVSVDNYMDLPTDDVYGLVAPRLTSRGTSIRYSFSKITLSIKNSQINNAKYLEFRLGGDWCLNYAVNSSYGVGYASGFQAGSQIGYEKGYAAGLGAVSNSSFMSLFNSIADTPLRFIYGLFNFDLFGTSVLVIVLTLLTGIIVFGIVKKFWK